MSAEPLSISTDQVVAFVELARAGSLRKAAEALLITEQGVRNRLLALEQRLGVELYRKSRGPRRSTPLTPRGQQFLPHAIAFLDRASELKDLFSGVERAQEVHVAATQYLILYVLIDAVRRFHKAYPAIHVRLSSHTEQEVEQVLLDRPDVAMGVAAPYEPAAELEYRHLFALDWFLITPKNHPLAKQRKKPDLKRLIDEPLILFERGSTGRQHVIDAFHDAGASPNITLETTNTEIIVRMVEAGLGVSIVPLMPSGAVTRGRKVAIVPLASTIRPINSGLLFRKGETRSAAVEAFATFLNPTASTLQSPPADHPD